MAEKLNVSISSYQKIEQGRMVLSLERFMDICRILKIDSYNDLLPAVSADTVEKINNSFIEGAMAFGHILTNAKYSSKLVWELIDKMKNNQIDKDEIINELEFLENYLAIIRKESTQKEYTFSYQLKKTDKID